MTHEQFSDFLMGVLKHTTDVLDSKSADYSSAKDKLYNFKLAAEVEGITPIEALRGMHLKHRTSLRQGLDELERGKIRPYEWWKEKLTDNINYWILFEALLFEEFFEE